MIKDITVAAQGYYEFYAGLLILERVTLASRDRRQLEYFVTEKQKQYSESF